MASIKNRREGGKFCAVKSPEKDFPQTHEEHKEKYSVTPVSCGKCIKNPKPVLQTTSSH